MAFETHKFLFTPGRALSSYPTHIKRPNNVSAILESQVARIIESQETLYADGRHALLLIFQGMDCAGKDSTIKHVLSGVNPQGANVANFREPTHDEVAHSYLWRYWRQMPRRGMMGVFNRSHYEEVLVMRVHPEMFEERQMPHPELDDAFWASRCADLAYLEDHLTRNGIHVVKFFLNLSREEQRERLLGRIDREHKNWKFDPRDVEERQFWDDYRAAYAEAIERTHTGECPWYIIPADHKPTTRALVAQIIAEKLDAMPIRIPHLSDQAREELAAAREVLMKD